MSTGRGGNFDSAVFNATKDEFDVQAATLLRQIATMNGDLDQALSRNRGSSMVALQRLKMTLQDCSTRIAKTQRAISEEITVSASNLQNTEVQSEQAIQQVGKLSIFDKAN